MTNLEKIRQMNDEELTRLFLQTQQDCKCKYCKFLYSEPMTCANGTCFDGVKAWLNSEVKE